MKYKWKIWLAPLVAVLIFGAVKGGSIWGKNGAAPVSAPVTAVALQEVQKASMDNVLKLSGTVLALEEAVISPKTPGRVSRVWVDNGDAVGAGQTLVSLESQEHQNMVAVSQATLKKAEASLVSVRANHQRMKELYQSGVISKKDFEDIETALLMAEADAGSAAAGLANAEESLRNTSICTPIRGLVADRNVSVGQFIAPGTPLMTVQDISSVYIVVNIEQGELARVQPGMTARVTLEGFGDRSFDGVVAVINPAANRAARVFETKIKVNNAEHIFKPGMFARVDIKIGTDEEVLAVPKDALTGKEGMFFVFLAEGEEAARRQVEIGRVIDQLVEVKSGLSLGDRVIVTNVNKLKDRDKIKIAD